MQIIKIFLYHVIFDMCISRVFACITNNFGKSAAQLQYEYLKTQEDSIILYGTRPWGNKRRVWKIDVGIMPEPKARDKARKYVKNAVANYKRRYNYNTGTGEVKKIS